MTTITPLYLVTSQSLSFIPINICDPSVHNESHVGKKNMELMVLLDSTELEL